ncbi:AAA family ATPase [Aeromonas veronii]|uniref:AAA family ATPase n=2 Tax=Aeromonas TaxID=642 RepID=UPI003D25504E|nr:AAA family ATPase [Aeromonas dhakensis]
MKIDIRVKNLGKIKNAKFNIRPITVLAGPNGTGKSFFTKTFYSVLNVVNKSAYHIWVSNSIHQVHMLLDVFVTRISYPAQRDFQLKSEVDDLLIMLKTNLDMAAEWENFNDYLNYAQTRATDIDVIINLIKSYESEVENKPKKLMSIDTSLNSLNKELVRLKGLLSDSRKGYSNSLTESLTSEIKDNFQVSSLGDLVRFSEEFAEIEVDDLMKIKITNNGGFNFVLGSDFINEVSSLSRVVFFESPAYWKVRDALKAAKEHQSLPLFLRKKSNNILTGVPKYFYDLDSALRTASKEDTTEGIDKLCASLQKELGGQFIFNENSLVFKSDTGHEISKNLISFGMTNIGMIHALLKNNVITSGSFVFIDEPETNLHPKWQVMLMELLVKLADSNVNIVIATHSIDMLKALEVTLYKNNKSTDENFMSIHYCDTDGELYEFDSNIPVKQLIEARAELNSSYTDLYFEGHSK